MDLIRLPIVNIQINYLLYYYGYYFIKGILIAFNSTICLEPSTICIILHMERCVHVSDLCVYAKMYLSINLKVVHRVSFIFQILQQAVEHKEEDCNTPLRKLSLAGKYAITPKCRIIRMCHKRIRHSVWLDPKCCYLL